MTIHKLSCHCKAIQLELKLHNGLEELTRCNCTICKRRNSIMAAIKIQDLIVLRGKDKLSLYKFGKKRHAEHFFCSLCGIYTHHRSYTKPENFEFNVACIEDIDTFKLNEVPVYDGIKL